MDDNMKEKLISFGQSELVSMFPDLSEDDPIYRQLQDIDIPQAITNLRAAKTSVKTMSTQGSLTSIDGDKLWKSEEGEQKARYEDVGFGALANGEVAAVILSGGQGTRLGFPGPKGMYNIGLPSGKTIFQLHIERIKKVRELAVLRSGSLTPCLSLPSIPIYIMTSNINDATIRAYFAKENYFGYPKDDIYFFQQGLQPCMTPEGKLIVESKTSLSMAPDGNGGIYPSLMKTGAFGDMIKRGINYLHIYGIDNVLTKSVDPAFLGYCVDNNLECGNKVVWRAHKGEKVGVTACVEDRMCVLEYSEIPADLAEAADDSGRLIWGAANICNHFLTTAFLKDVVFPTISGSYHLASKKIPYYDPKTDSTITPKEPNGYKLEMFIFDVFPAASRWGVMEVSREDEFAPVKNAPGDASDSPDTARALLTAQATRWLEAVGASVLDPRDSDSVDGTDADNGPEPQCEISPLRSYAGEGLRAYYGQELKMPCHLEPTEPFGCYCQIA
jgi:UDP-N-acetylglucosamine/UDP-N-acetylgalactosamine diphosphorylase